MYFCPLVSFLIVQLLCSYGRSALVFVYILFLNLYVDIERVRYGLSWRDISPASWPRTDTRTVPGISIVLILEGYSEIGTHVKSNLCCLICLSHLYRSKAVTNLILFLYACATCLKLLSYISTMIQANKRRDRQREPQRRGIGKFYSNVFSNEASLWTCLSPLSQPVVACNSTFYLWTEYFQMYKIYVLNYGTQKAIFFAKYCNKKTTTWLTNNKISIIIDWEQSKIKGSKKVIFSSMALTLPPLPSLMAWPLA